MQNSSNSLLHFTKRISVLGQILTTRFLGSYCKEHFEYKDLNYTIYVPKISFCDIPEETIHRYTHYGKYCIGLRKEWGKSKRLNPVLYIEKHSIIAESFITSFNGTGNGVDLVNRSVNELKILFDSIKSQEHLSEKDKNLGYSQIKEMLDKIEELGKIVTFGQFMPYYVKHYEDKLETREETFDCYRFYDEREWCYVPEDLQKSNKLYMTKEQYDIWREANKEKCLLDDVSLEFCFEDITHLIVERDEDQTILIKEIQSLPAHRINDEERNRLINLITVFDTLEKG